jgi:hypothetical protein
VRVGGGVVEDGAVVAFALAIGLEQPGDDAVAGKYVAQRFPVAVADSRSVQQMAQRPLAQAVKGGAEAVIKPDERGARARCGRKGNCRS